MSCEQLSCEICGSQKSVFPDHYEEHIDPPREINICRSCHTGIHTKHTRKRSGPQPRNIRKLIKLGGSQVVTLPMEWVKAKESLKKKKLTGVYTLYSYSLVNNILLVALEEDVEEAKEFLRGWDILNNILDTLTPSRKKLIIKLGRQWCEMTHKTLTRRDIKNILKFNPGIREFVLNEIENKQAVESEQVMGPVV